jgi:hypothetical protein
LEPEAKMTGARGRQRAFFDAYADEFGGDRKNLRVLN